jgi:hypothetical protein
MNRRTSPYMLLFSGRLVGTAYQQRQKKVGFELLPRYMGSPPAPGDLGTPVSLRWKTHPSLGFPRQPFQLYRRPAEDFKFFELASPRTVNGERRISWNLRDMAIVSFYVAVTGDAPVTVEALDRRFEIIPGQRITFEASGFGKFCCPFIAALRFRGQADVSRLMGVDQLELVNAKDWTLIQQVGFPFGHNAIAAEHYQSHPQGFASAPVEGDVAAKARLEIQQLMQLSLPPTGVDFLPAPDWRSPEPGDYLKHLSGGVSSPLALISECLRNTDDTDLARLQRDYRHRISGLPGVRQADIEGHRARDEMSVDLPLVESILLATSVDSDAATALGFGSIDFPLRVAGNGKDEFLRPDDAIDGDYDYMVTATYVLPRYGPLELAAIAHARPVPQTPESLVAARLRLNRPAAQDEPANEAVELRWNYGPDPYAYALLASYEKGQTVLRNARRAFDDGHHPYVPNRSIGDNGQNPEGDIRFVDPVSPLPLAGRTAWSYRVAAMDMFGRWSGYGSTTHQVAAPSVMTPVLHQARLEVDEEALQSRTLPEGHVPCSIQIEFSWDWTDRSPWQIEFTGGFFDPSATDIPEFTSGFVLDDVPPLDPKVTVGFSASGAPVVDLPPSKAQVRIAPPDEPYPPDAPITETGPYDNPNVVRFILTVKGVICDFSARREVAYAVYARALEHVRQDGPYSERSNPVVARLLDPVPPTPPTLAAGLRWTALPDATGLARGELTWDPVPEAAGYVVWQATETALRNALGIDLDGSGRVPERADELLALLADPVLAGRGLSAFTRLNTGLLHDTLHEVILPGRTDRLYASHVTAVDANHLESSRSETVLFAVPRSVVPAQPRLDVRAAPASDELAGGLRLTAVPGRGSLPAGYRVYRARDERLLRSPDNKGLPKIDENHPGWAAAELTRLDGLAEQGQAVLDPVSPSWYPYYYQVTAVSADQPDWGRFGGESVPSATRRAFYAPDSPSALTLTGIDFADEPEPTSYVLTFTTDLPVRPTPMGPATIEVLHRIANPGRGMDQRRVLLVETTVVDEGEALAPIVDAPENLVPEISRCRKSDGSYEYSLRLPASVDRGTVMVRNPRGRVTKAVFGTQA